MADRQTDSWYYFSNPFPWDKVQIQFSLNYYKYKYKSWGNNKKYFIEWRHATYCTDCLDFYPGFTDMISSFIIDHRRRHQLNWSNTIEWTYTKDLNPLGVSKFTLVVKNFGIDFFSFPYRSHILECFLFLFPSPSQFWECFFIRFPLRN